MTLIRPTPLSYLNCSHSPVTAPLYPTPGQDAKSMFNQALGTTEIRDYPAETDWEPLKYVITQRKLTCPRFQVHRPKLI
jgi:hypothetical protein